MTHQSKEKEERCEHCGKRRKTAPHWRYYSDRIGDVPDGIEQSLLCMKCSIALWWKLNSNYIRKCNRFIKLDSK